MVATLRGEMVKDPSKLDALESVEFAESVESVESVDPRAATQAGSRDASESGPHAADDDGPLLSPALKSAVRRRVKASLFEDKPLPPRVEPGAVLGGRYRIISLLGSGGMGVVYRAHDSMLGEDVAIKFLPPALADDPVYMERLVVEARTARKVTHPNVCRVHDIGEIDGRMFLSMEYIDGEDLSSLLGRIGRLPSEKAAEFAQQLCGGLVALHERGLLHRDLKPSNLMIDGRGKLRLADFGLAISTATPLGAHSSDGTPAYMAPEQLRGEGVSVRSEIYALGLVLYEMLTGRHPFASGSQARALEAPPSLDSAARGIDPSFEPVVRQCLEPFPEHRPASVSEVAAALPGGDPFAAALAAGDTPSPEVVANAAAVGGLSFGKATLLLGFTVLLSLLYAALAPRTTVLGQAVEPLEPAVLVHRARSLLDEAGVQGERDEFVTLCFDTELVEGTTDPSRPETGRLGSAGPSPLLLHYRRSTGWLHPLGPFTTSDDPPLREPGEARVTLDGRGDLRRFEVVAAGGSDEPGEDEGSSDWAPFLTATGVDLSSLEEAEPQGVPPVPADEQRAWTGRHEQTGLSMRLEGARWGGRVVHVQSDGPWTVDARGASEVGSSGLSMLGAVLGLGFIGGGLLLAVGTLRRRDGDVRGALRVGVVVMLIFVAGVLLDGHYAGPLGLLLLVWSALQQGVAIAAVSFVCYLVVEVHARRLFPGTMISWSRLLQGRWRDPMIGRDLLIGASFGLGLGALVGLLRVIPGLDLEPLPLLGPDVLLGGRHALAQIFSVEFTALSVVLQVYAAFILIRIIVRNRYLHFVAFVLAWSGIKLLGGPIGDIGWWVSAGAVLIESLAMWVLLSRYGLMATVATQIVVNLVLFFPLTADASRWYFEIGLLAFVVLVALPAAAWRNATSLPRSAGRHSSLLPHRG